MNSPHLPEPVEFKVGEPWQARVKWIIISSGFGVVIFIAVHGVYSRVFERQQDVSLESRSSSLNGVWVGDGTQAITAAIPKNYREPWLLVMSGQAYDLDASELNASQARASGTVSCNRNGHEVGHFKIEPAKGNPNRLSIAITFDDGREEVIVIRRAE